MGEGKAGLFHHTVISFCLKKQLESQYVFGMPCVAATATAVKLTKA